MRPSRRTLPLFLSLSLAVAAIPTLNELKNMTARFAPVELRVDTSKLSGGDKQALAKLIEAPLAYRSPVPPAVMERQSEALRRLTDPPRWGKRDSTISGSTRPLVIIG